MKKRNPILVFFWVAGLVILVQIIFGIGLVIPGIITPPETSNYVDHIFSKPEFSIFIGLYSILICIPAMYLITKYLWKRDFQWMGLQLNGILFINGLGAGLVFPLISLAIIALISPVDIQLNLAYSIFEIGATTLGVMGMMLFIGYEEEILFRSMLTREWATTPLGWLYSTIIAGAIFGFIHIFQMNELSLSIIIRIVISGLVISGLLVAIYIRYHSLWPAIGFHAGWNFIIGAVMGTPISGITINRSLFIVELNGSSWISGGKFGIEISLVTNILIVIATIFLLRYPFGKEIDLMSSKM